MQPAFHKQRLLLILNIINEETTSFITRLKSLPPKSAINICHEFLQLTISIISRAMFSTALKEEMKSMVDALEALAVYASSWMKSLIKIPTQWPRRANTTFNSNCKVFDDIIYGIINRRRKERNNTTLPEQGDLLDMLMEYYDEESKSGMSEKQLRDEVTTMFMAGHETTAQTLSYIMYHLAKEKEVYQTVNIYRREKSKAQRDLIKSLEEKTSMQHEMLELEAKALRSQMNPHFIFNCMNSIKALIQQKEEDPFFSRTEVYK